MILIVACGVMLGNGMWYVSHLWVTRMDRRINAWRAVRSAQKRVRGSGKDGRDGKYQMPYISHRL